jgi:CAAX prenyl protease-like protein
MTTSDRQDSPPSNTSSSRPRLPLLAGVSDTWAYVLPMAIFLGFIWVGGLEFPRYYPVAYALRAVLVAALLVLFWRHYTKIRWNHWWLGVVVGVVGVFQWVGMQLWLQEHFSLFRPKPQTVFDPGAYFADSPMLYAAFIAIRIAGATLVVPVMEELFWRDWLWRTVLAPNDFKLAEVGEPSPGAFFIVSGMFAVVHGNWWLTAIVWAMLVGGLLMYTRSLGACIIAHAVTNLLLAGYVLYTGDWSFW